MNNLVAALSLSLTVAIAGCGAVTKRPVFEAQDQIKQFDSADILGKWDVTVLNALEGEQVSSLVYTYEPDGTWLIEMTQNASGMDLQIEGYGRWEVRGEEIFASVEDVKVISENALAKMLAGMMKGVINKSSGVINPYEIRVDRMVWLVENDQALQLDRL